MTNFMLIELSSPTLAEVNPPEVIFKPILLASPE